MKRRAMTNIFHRSAQSPIAFCLLLAGLFTGCSVCTSCGGSPSGTARAQQSTTPVSTSSGGTSMASPGADTPTSESARDESNDSVAGQSVAPQPRTTTTSTNGAATAPSTPTGGEAMISTTDGVAMWTQRLAAAELQLQSSGTACRDICRASGDVCTASRELCALTGDREGAPPTDPRCARARASCDRATQQRNNACPVCNE